MYAEAAEAEKSKYSENGPVLRLSKVDPKVLDKQLRAGGAVQEQKKPDKGMYVPRTYSKPCTCFYSYSCTYTCTKTHTDIFVMYSVAHAALSPSRPLSIDL